MHTVTRYGLTLVINDRLCHFCLFAIFVLYVHVHEHICSVYYCVDMYHHHSKPYGNIVAEQEARQLTVLHGDIALFPCLCSALCSRAKERACTTMESPAERWWQGENIGGSSSTAGKADLALSRKVMTAVLRLNSLLAV